MIENKVDADFQPDQLGRYRKRGQTGIAQGRWADFEVGLLSPLRYSQGNATAGLFDFRIAYEDVESWLRGRADQRSLFRAEVLAKTGQGASVYRRVADPLTDEFWGKVYECCQSEFPELERKPIHVTKGSPWILFAPSVMPNGVSINFKNDRGFMDLTFNGWSEAGLRKRIASAIEADMMVTRTGKSASVRLQFKPLSMSSGAMADAGEIRAALQCAQRLLDLYRRVGPILKD